MLALPGHAKLLAVVALLGTALLITEHYPWPLIGLAALALPLLVAPHLPGWMDRRRAGPLWKVLPAAIVLYAVVFLALLVLRVRSARPSFVGGRR